MADNAINDAKTSCTHPGATPGKKCPVCGKLVPANPSAVAEEWKGDADHREKHS